MHSTDSFEKADGTKIAFIEYYESVYQGKVQGDKQPLLVSRPKDKDKQRDMTGPIFLLPQFCSITGMTFNVINIVC